MDFRLTSIQVVELSGRGQKRTFETLRSVVVRFGLGGPLDRHNLPVLYLKAGDDIRYDAASGVEIGRLARGGERRAVRVTADDDLATILQPAGNSFPDGLVPLDIASPAGCASPKIDELQSSPNVLHQEAIYSVESIAHKVGLMSMDGEYTTAGPGVTQDQALVDGDAIFIRPVVPPPPHFVVAQDEMEPVLLVESVQQIERALIGVPDIPEVAVFPQVVAIPDLDVREPIVVVTGQCMVKQLFVPGKTIGPAFVPSMAVAEKDDARGIVEGDILGCLIDSGQSSVGKGVPFIQSGFGVLQR